MVSDEAVGPASGMSAEEQRGLLHLKPGGVTWQPRLSLTADEQIRMKALECATHFMASADVWKRGELQALTYEFEDYLRNGRD